MTRVRNTSFRESRETVIEDAELDQALEKANTIPNEYFRLSAVANAIADAALLGYQSVVAVGSLFPSPKAHQDAPRLT